MFLTGLRALALWCSFLAGEVRGRVFLPFGEAGIRKYRE